MGVTAMRARNLAHDGKPEPGALGAPGHERLEQPIRDGRRHAGPSVANAQMQLVVLARRRKSDGTAGRRVLDGIENEIVETAADLINIEPGSNG